jgi:hypothetical protein
MKNTTLIKPLMVLSLSILLFGCGQSLPDCASDEAKNSLVKMIKEKVITNNTGKWYLEPKFEVINTESKTPEKIQCTAQITFTILPEYQVSKAEKISATYSIQKNELEKNSFSVTALIDFVQIKNLNNEGWVAYQNYLFKKADIEYLSDESREQVSAQLTGNPLAILALPAVMEKLSFIKVHQKLLDAGWKFDGESKDDKMTALYSKNKYILSIKTIDNAGLTLMGFKGPWVDDVNIWEE